MALEHFLKMYPCPEDPCIYTGLFKNWERRQWSDRPNKCRHGVSYTQYADAMDIMFYDSSRPGKFKKVLEEPGVVSVIGQTEYVSLFEMFHGDCWYYARFFHEKNPSWQVETILKGNSWDSVLHSFCTKVVNGRKLFADARGITDDTKLFFSDFRCSQNAYICNDPKLDRIPEAEKEDFRWTPEAFAQAYDYIFGNLIVTKQAA